MTLYSRVTPSARCPRAGFSLVEIILALGVISFAIVAILGMFPVAVQAATDSQQETQAALIARGLFEQIASQTGASRKVTVGPLDKSDSQTVTLSLSTPKAGQPLGTLDSDASPVSAGKARYTLTYTVTPVTAAANLAQLTLTVATPTRSYPFTTLVSYE